MRQVIAILGDSLREAWDRRALLVLLGLCLLPILFCFSLSFESTPLGDVLADQAAGLIEFRKRRGNAHISELSAAQVEVGEVRAVDDDAFGADLRGGHAVELRFASPAELDRLATTWFAFQGEAGFDGEGAAAPEMVDGVPRARAFLTDRFRAFGYEQVAVAGAGTGTGAGAGAGDAWRVAVRSEFPHEIGGATKISAAFGALKMPTGASRAEFVILLQSGLTSVFIGFVGMLIALSACSGFVPSMLQKGTLDLVLARPISRTKLLLAKYVGGLWFVFCTAAFLVSGCWLGLAFASGYSNPWFLGTIATMTACFAVLYSVAVLTGVRTRTGGISALAALAVWFLSSSVATARQLLGLGLFATESAATAEIAESPAWVKQLVEVLYTVLPKIKDFDHLNTLLLGRAHLSEGARARLFRDEMLPNVDWVLSLGTTAAFTAVMLALAVHAFRRRDC